MSFCATWVLFDSSGRSLRSQQRNGPSSLNLFLRGRVGTFQLQGDQPPSAVRSRSHVQGIPLSDTKLLWQFSNKHHHWVRDTLSPYYNNKVFILLQEKISSSQIIHIAVSQSGARERDRERERDRDKKKPESKSARERAKGKQFWSVL